ncbi:MAG: hypothetical protein JWQ98_1115 [Chlorobi bacterium]|nr:hypothetical protein [Chlorobiota bacterium]
MAAPADGGSMAEKDAVQEMIHQLGQSQHERTPEELGVHYADADERTTEDLLRFAREFAKSVNYYPSAGGDVADWSPFFAHDDAAIARLASATDGNVEPHLALFIAFLKLYERPREILNGITGRHLDFYLRDVLRLHEKDAVPDRVHLIIDLKKGTAPVAIAPEHLFSAGKDATSVELIYAPVRETVVNRGTVASLRSIHVDRNDRNGHGTVRQAPVANSADGLGSPFKGLEPRWNAFGNGGLPAAEIGFALASTVLRMKEGRRSVTIDLALSGTLPSGVAGAFDVYITGEKGWMGPYRAASTMSGGTLRIAFDIDEKEKGVVDYNAKIHGHTYAAGAPVAQILLNNESAAIGYLDLAGLTVRSAHITVDVKDITSLTLESDGGTLNPKKAFQPFGSQPTAGSRFWIGYPEALSKRLSRVVLNVAWKDAPVSFQEHYTGYVAAGAITNYSFTAGVTFNDASGSEHHETVRLFESPNAALPHTITITPGGFQPSIRLSRTAAVRSLRAAGSPLAARQADLYLRRMPVSAASAPTVAREHDGFITLSLTRDFLHATYRAKNLENILAYVKGPGALVVLKEPYTPVMQSLTLSYTAGSEMANIASDALEDFAADVKFYHITPFGERREHGYLRRQVGAGIAGADVPLLPVYEHDGELLIGMADLHPGESTSLLFQAAEGSADPDLPPQTVEWSILRDNYWKRLDAGELVLDTTGNLLASGLVGIVVPLDATADNTVLPAGHIWIRAAVRRNIQAVSQLIDVVANGVEARFIDNRNDPRHLETALPAGKIAKLKNGLAAVKNVKQPYASFGGSPTETRERFQTRISERSRHKDRCVTLWDYERIVLEAFPRVHRVKCVPHAKEGSTSAPGHVLIVVVPDLRNRNALDPLQPRVDADTIGRITRHLEARAGMGVRIRVKNPRYQKIRLDFKVRFRDGREFNYYSQALQRELIRVLSPWAFDAGRELSFGGSIYKSVLLDIVEDLEYVDYVTDFKMFTYSGAANDSADLNEARAATPDTILVSDAIHSISEAPESGR